MNLKIFLKVVKQIQVFPGGLHYSYNISHEADVLSRYPMNRLTDMITNFGAVVVGCIVLKFFRFRKPAAIAIMIFSFFEVGIHFMIGITDMKIFAEEYEADNNMKYE